MIKRITLFTVLACLIGFSVRGQEVWSLERCIDYARENSLQVKSSLYAVELAQVNLLGDQMSRLPSLNASVSGGYQFGRTINPATNEFITESTATNSYSLNGGIILYNGGLINNAIKQSKLNLEAANLDALATANDISLQVATAYLGILLAQEQLENARKQQELSTRQLEQTDKLINAGSLPVNDRLDWVAQIALNEQRVIEAQNQLTLNYLILKQLLELDPGKDITVVAPEVVLPEDPAPERLQLLEVYQTALSTQPQIRAGELRLSSALLQEKIARAGMLPRLVLQGNFNTYYSDRFLNFAAPINERVVFNDPVIVRVNGDPASVEFPRTTNDGYPVISFSDQLKENFGQSIGLGLSIPIYNNHANRVNIERARVNMLNTEVNNQQIKQQLKSDVQRAITDARAALQSYEASQRSVEAAQAAFDNAQKRFSLGAINTLEFTTASNNLDQAKVNLIQAKYQYLFNLKVVDFYMGREITLD